MPVLMGPVGEMPGGCQRLLLVGAALAVLAFGAGWVYSGGRLAADEPLLGFAVMGLLGVQWLAVALMLRPRGQGMRMHRGRRVLLYGFASCHGLFAILNALVPVFVARPGERLYGTGPWGWCALFALGGVVLAVAAWQAGLKAAAPRESGPL